MRGMYGYFLFPLQERCDIPLKSDKRREVGYKLLLFKILASEIAEFQDHTKMSIKKKHTKNRMCWRFSQVIGRMA